jgi:integrase
VGLYQVDNFGNFIIEELETIATSFNAIAKMMMSKKCNCSVKCKNLSKSKRDEMSLSKSKNIGKKGAEKVNMQKGSISFRPKENRWMYRYRDKMQNNKMICGYARTQKEAKALLKQALQDYYDRLREFEKSGKTTAKDNQTNSNAIGKGMTLNTWFNYWVETFKKQEVKESTYIQYIEIYNRYAAKSIGNKKVVEVSASDIQTFINDIPAYSALKKTRQIFRDLFDLLYKQGYIKSNPMTLVVLPKRNKDDAPDEDDNDGNEILLHKDEIALLDYLSVDSKSKKQKNKYYYPVKFIIYSGLRKGEMLGLQWKHIDFKNDTIKVTQQWNYNSKKITSVKSKAGNRTIPLLKKAKEALLELSNLKIHSAEDYIFLNDCIGITQRLAHYTKVLGFQINPHLLRHTFASRCYAAGLDPIAIRDLMGHETVDTTLNVYTHTLTTEDKEVIDYMRSELIEKGILILTHNNNAFDTYSDTQNMIL